MSYGIVKSREIVGAGDKKSSTRKKEKKMNVLPKSVRLFSMTLEG